MSNVAMKDSGEDWIGTIPCEWQVAKISSFCELQLGKMLESKPAVSSSRLIKYICAANVHYDGVDLSALKEMYYSEDERRNYSIRLGDLLVVEGGAGAGGCAIVKNLAEEVCFQNSIIRIRGTVKNVENGYLSYWLRSVGERGYVAYICNVATIPHFTKEKVRDVPMPIPPIDTQRRIVAYLDEKTAAIDGKVAVLAKKLAAYKRLKKSIINQSVTRGVDAEGNDLCDLRDLCARKNSSRGECRERRAMKDSGVDWIGSVPEGWGVERIGSLYDLRSVKVCDKVFRPLSVGKMGVVPQMESVAKTNNGDDRKLVRVGDFVINSRSDRRGACGISSYDGSVSVINIVLKPRSHMHPGYYNWLFHTSMFADEFYNAGKGIVDDLWSTRWGDMKAISIVVPPLAEQHAIADYLNAECAKIDRAAEIVARQIDAYKRLKRSLINEVVTGKRKVA